MLTASSRRKILLVLLFTVLVTPVLSAAGPKPESAQSAQVAEQAWPDFISRIWSFLRTVGSKEGCNIDPDGCPLQKTPQTKEGCNIDPNGRCLP